MREYHAAPSIRRYIIVDPTSTAMSLHFRTGAEVWQTEVLTDDD